MNKTVILFLITSGFLTLVFKRPRESAGLIPAPDPSSERGFESSADQEPPLSTEGVLADLRSGNIPELTSSQIDRFLDSRKHDAPGLLAAWQLTGDSYWLDQAANDHPDDPRVSVAMLSRDGALAGYEWAERLKENDPENGAGQLFSALADFTLGDVESAEKELLEWEGKPQTTFYTESMVRTMIEAYDFGGYHETVAELTGYSKVGLPFVSLMTELNREISSSMKHAIEKGDHALAQSLGQAGLAAASQMSGETENKFLLSQVISISMERKLLHEMDSFDLVPRDDKIVLERIFELDQDIEAIKRLQQDSHAALTQLSDAQLGQYIGMVGKEGEAKALQWAIANTPRQSQL